MMDKNDDASQVNKISKNTTQGSKPESTPEKDVENLQELMKKLEKKGEDNLKELYKQNNVNEVTIKNIIENGENEFIKKTGRYMTYGEMRQMYG
jgi:flagellar motility protein MotE (MotC chaperone)